MSLKNKKLIITGVCVGAILVGTVGTYAYQSQAADVISVVYKETTVERGNLTVGVTESGSVSIGTLTQTFELEESSGSSSSQSSMSTMGGMSGSTSSNSGSAALEIEEVYVAVGQNVEEGEALFKISKDSIEEYRESLKDAITDAEVSLNEAELNAKKQQLSADYNYDVTIAKGNLAEQSYQATLAKLQAEIDAAQEEYDYQFALADYYYSLVQAGDNSYAEKLSQAEAKKAEAKEAITLAENNYTTKALEAKKEYEETILEYNNAGSQYAIDVNGIDSDVDSAQETLTEAKEALETFEAFIGDGNVYAEYTGKLLSVGYAAGDSLSTDTDIATYSDATAVTMTVSVSQEDISQVAIGDAVLIQLTAYEGEEFEGVVSGMETSTSSGSSTVSYNVTVTFSGDVSKIYADMTGNVTFIQKQVSDVIYVSNKAVINEGTTSYVKVKDADGNFTKVQVITGFSDGINVEIVSGLEEGDIAIIESQVVSE